MAIYISKLALDKIPSKNFLSATSMNGIYLLQTDLFSSSKELVTLVDNPYKTLPVQKNDPRVNVVRRIKIALKIISQIPGVNYNLPGGYSMNSEFDDITELAVKSFQDLKDLEETGIVDALTLSWLDMVLADTIFDLKNGLYLGNKKNLDDQYVGFSDHMDSDGLYTYTFRYYDHDEDLKTIEIKDKSIHYVQILSDVDDQHYAGFPTSGINKIIEKNLDFSKKNYSDQSVLLRKKEKKVKLFAPKRLPESGIHVIGANDNITSIIQQYYYVDHEIAFQGLDGYNGVIKIPKKDFRSPNEVRSKYYMLLLYFYNLNSKNQEGPIKINGLVKNDAFYNQLNSIFIHENKNPLNQNLYPTSKLPNFYSFLRSIDQYSNFSASQFTVTPGQAIVIPPKGFTEMLYYHLNFNPDLMLSGGNYVTSLPSTLKNEIAQEIQTRQNHQETFIDLLNDTYDQAATRIVDFYNETIKFFKDSYQYVIFQIAQYWARGTGSHFKAGASITWGIPVKTGFEAEYFMWRAVTPRGELKICLSQRGKFELGLDTGLEAGAGVGIGATKRNKKINAGLYAKAGVELTAMAYIEGTAEFEFPIERNNTALISMCMAAMGPATSGMQMVTMIASKMLSYLEVVNLDPYQYLTKMNLSAGEEIDGSGDITLGVRTEQETPANASNFVDSDADADKKESWYSFNELLKYLNFDFEFNANCKLVDIEYTADYEGAVFDPKTLSKKPTKVELQIGNALSASAKIGPNEGLMKLLKIAGISDEAQELSFDRGIFFYTKFDIDMSGLAPGRKINSIESSYKIGTSTGSLDYLQTGDEFSVLLDRDALRKIMSDSNHFTVLQAIDVIRSIQYRKKDDIEEDKSLLGNNIGSIMAWYESKDVVVGTLKEWVLEKLGIEFNGIFDVDVTLNIASHAQYQTIRRCLSSLMDFLMWWYGFAAQHASNQKMVLGVQNWLWKKFNEIIYKGDLLHDDVAALELIDRKIFELIEAVKANTIQSTDPNDPWAINLYNTYRYDVLSDDGKKQYTKNVLSEVFSLASRAADFAMNGVNATGWVMDFVFTKLFCYLRDVQEFTFALEGGINLSGAINAKIGAAAKVAFNVDLEGGMFDRTVVKNKNEYTINMLDAGDPLRAKFYEIEEKLGPQNRNITDIMFNITK